MPLASRSTRTRRPAIAVARLLALCVAVAALLIAPYPLTSPVSAAGATSATAAPDDVAPMLVEEPGDRVPAARPARSSPRSNAELAALTTAGACSALSTASSSLRLESRRGLAASAARRRTHADFMVFLI
ncbi:MAG: hypothetical protein KF782_24280 [Labilithrix sp.]|nr:hypothetical protein [Labilithrix sp.]